MKIKTLEDLNARRADLNNEVELARIKLDQNKAKWQQEIKPLRKAADWTGNMLVNKHQGIVSRGLQLGVNAMLAKTVLRRLPVPFNFILPYIAQNLVTNYAHEHSEELLVRFLKTVKRLTDEKETEDVLQEMIKEEGITSSSDQLRSVSGQTRGV